LDDGEPCIKTALGSVKFVDRRGRKTHANRLLTELQSLAQLQPKRELIIEISYSPQAIPCWKDCVKAFNDTARGLRLEIPQHFGSAQIVKTDATPVTQWVSSDPLECQRRVLDRPPGHYQNSWHG
jgi:hypothetical protein